MKTINSKKTWLRLTAFVIALFAFAVTTLTTTSCSSDDDDDIAVVPTTPTDEEEKASTSNAISEGVTERLRNLAICHPAVGRRLPAFCHPSLSSLAF